MESSTTQLATEAQLPAGTDQQPEPSPSTEPRRLVPFYKRRKFIISQIILIPLSIALLFILLFPVVTAIVQLVVNRAVLNVSVAQISSPQNSSFGLTLNGIITHTGIIPATIDFTEAITVTWLNEQGTEVSIGNMTLPDTLHAHSKRADLNQSTTFHITDPDNFTKFAQAMITQPNFTWGLSSSNLRVQAAKFPVSHGIKFNKQLTLPGFNSFNGNVTLQNFQLPSDNSGGGIDFVATTVLNNSSPFSLNLGTVIFDLSYQNLSLGTGTGTNTSIAPGPNTITLQGVLQPQNGSQNLATLSQLFTNYINSDMSKVIATGKSTLQPDGTAISWLSAALEALQLDVPFVPATPINPIRTISIGDFSLQFFQGTPWSPSVASQTVQAGMQLPFGFQLDIGEISNNFNISKDGAVVGGLSTPIGASTSDIKVLGPTDTEGTINISITNTNLSSNGDDEHTAFASFNKDLTMGNNVSFQLVGQSRAIANLSVGTITLDPIKVNVTTSLNGLQGLSNNLTVINSVDVTGGISQGIQLGIDVSIENPSNLNLQTGNLVLQLMLAGGSGSVLGTALMPNLNLKMGDNNVTVSSLFDANASPDGMTTLNNFVGGKDTALTIKGFSGSTNISSLSQAFEALSIDVTLPGLTTQLLSSASLEILNTTGRTDNISHVSVQLVNPFSTPLRITKIQSSVAAFGIPLGSIDTSKTSSNFSFSSPAKSTTLSPTLDLDMNFQPSVLFTLTRLLAVQAGLDPAPIDGIVEVGGIQYLPGLGPSSREITVMLEKRDNVFTNFNLPSYVEKAFSKLTSDVQLTTTVEIGEYTTQLSYTQNSVPTKTDKSLDLILPVLAQPIVQRIIDGSTLGINTVVITSPAQASFATKLEGGIQNAGPFDATISFPAGLTIAWNGKSLGTMEMPDVKVTGDQGATIDTSSTPARFSIADVGTVTDFTKALVTEDSFTWDISTNKTTVDAIGITVSGVQLNTKSVTLKGMNGLKGGVKINTFDLPANDPAGGIHLTLQAETDNPSQVGVELSSIGFDTFASGIMIAPVQSTSAVTLAPMSSTNLSLAGRLVPQTTDQGLSVVSNIFNNFVQGQDSDVSVHGASAGPSSAIWLNEGIQALVVDTVLPNRGKLNVIKSISLNELELFFTEDAAYAPLTTSKDTQAAFTLPFAFPLDITALDQSITVSFDNAPFAQLVIPRGPASTDVTARIIHLTFSEVPFAALGDQHSTFDTFLAATTIGKSQTIGLSGAANADASTAVGVLNLKNINFNVQSSIAGLQGLNAKPVSVANLDVAQGFSDFLLITVDTGLFNPSNLTIGTGDVEFDIQFQGQTIGSVEMSNLVIKPGNGNYSTDVHYSPQGSAQVAAGQTLLENFLQGIDSATTIFGSTSSTPIDSLKQALSEIKLSPVTIPALHQTLIQSASLTFPTNIIQTRIASTSFTLANPFSASINLITVGATAVYNGLKLGTIENVDESAHPIHADGHSNITSPTLPMNFNLDPSTIIKLLEMQAQKNNVDLGPLVDMFAFVLANPGVGKTINTSVDTGPAKCVSGHQFDVDGAILRSLQNLRVDLQINSAVKLDDYATDLAFNQTNVSANTDNTALFLIGAVAPPVAQNLVDGSVLQFTEANITNISNGGFDLSLVGSLTNVGPLDALITFVDPVTVNWQGHDIAQITLPPVCAAANSGVPNYRTTGSLKITDLEQFTSFATFLLHNPSFEWTISTNKLRLEALGTIFDGVSLEKTVSFKAFNNLPGVTISNFQLPADSPQGGIEIQTDASIPSPAQLSIDLGTVGFEAFFDGVDVGPLSATNLFLAASSVTTTHLSGRMIPQSGSNLNTIGGLFSKFLAGENQTLITKGASVQPGGSSGPVPWLTTAFQTLSIPVVLPGQKFKIIQSIELNDLNVTLEDQSQTFAPPTSSKNTVAQYKNPFGFSLQVIQSGQNINMGFGGTTIAQLNLPVTNAVGGVSTGNVVNLPISWTNQLLKSLNNAGFGQLFAAVTNKPSVSIELSGTAQVVAKTAIGNIPISGIPFDVTSTLQGVNAFGGTASLSNVTVAGSGGDGGNQFIVSPLTTTLQNPSNVSLETVDISLAVSYRGVKIGRAVINTFNLGSGENTFPTEFHYQPDNANDTVAQDFLTEFITSDNDISLAIHGDDESTPFMSLEAALSVLALTTQLKGLNQPRFITSIQVFITLESLVDNLVSVIFEVFNPLDAALTLDFVQSDSGVNGETFAHFDQPFTGFTVQPGQTASSGEFGNVLLTQGAIASLAIIPLGFLDIQTAATVQVGDGGYTIPWLHLNQLNVPTTYTLDLTALEEKAKEISSSASAKSTISANNTEVSTSNTEVASATTTASTSNSEVSRSTTATKSTAESFASSASSTTASSS